MILTNFFEALLQRPGLLSLERIRSVFDLPLDAISWTNACNMPDDASWCSPRNASAITGQDVFMRLYLLEAVLT